MRLSSVDSLRTGDYSVANWCNVLAVLDAVADRADDTDVYALVANVIEAFPLQREWAQEAQRAQ